MSLNRKSAFLGSAYAFRAINHGFKGVSILSRNLTHGDADTTEEALWKTIFFDSNTLIAAPAYYALTNVPAVLTTLADLLVPKQIITNSVTDDTLELAFTGVLPGSRLVVCIAETDSGAGSSPNPSGYTSTAGLTWTKVVDSGTTTSGNAEIWTAVYAGGGNETVVFTWSDAASSSGETLSGVGYETANQESSPGGASAVATGQLTPSLGITTGRSYSIVFGVVSDFNANDGASRAIRNSAIESYYRFSSTFFTSYFFYKIVPAVGAAGNFGYSAPSMTGSLASIILYEVRRSGSNTYTMAAATGSFSLTGVSSNLIRSRIMPAVVQSYAITGIASALSKGKRLIADAQSYTISGIANAFTRTRIMPAAVQSYAITGIAANLLNKKILTADVRSYSITAISANLLVGKKVIANVQSYTISGVANNLLRSRILAADVRSYAINGIAANFKRTYISPAAPAAYTITGYAAGLVKTGSYSLSANTATFSISGITIGFIRTRIMTASVQGYSITGVAAALLQSKLLSAAMRTYSITGIAAGLIKTGSYQLTANTGSFILSGSPSFPIRTRILPTTTGSFLSTGIDVGWKRTYLLTAISGPYTISGFPIGMINSGVPIIPLEGFVLIDVLPPWMCKIEV